MTSFRNVVLRALGFGLAVLGGSSAAAQELGEPAQPGANDKLLIYPLRGVLDGPLAEALKKDVEGWLQREPDIRALVLEIDSPGTLNGRLAPASEAASFLAGLKGVRVIARIRRDQEAGNASALLGLAAMDVVMSPGASLGFWSNERADGAVEVVEADEKAAAKLFQEYSTRRKGPIGRSHLAVAMVSRSHPTIFKARFERVVNNNREQEFRFLTQEETANLGPLDKQNWRPPDVTVSPAGQRLTLDPEKAREYGFALPVETDDLNEVLLKLKLPIGPENIIDHTSGGVLKPMSPDSQTLVNFLNHPVVRFLLILLGTLGLLLEVKLPGTLFPALGGLVCFAIFFIAGFFPARGASIPTTNVYEVLLFLLGLGLMGVELLLLPGVLVFGLSGAAACLIGLVLAMIPPANATVAGALDFRGALTILISSAGTSALVFLLLLRFLPHSRFLDKSGIVIHSAIQGTPTADSALEAQAQAAALMGKVGSALTPLRPAGLADFDGERVDVVAQGDFVEKGQKVQIIEADGTRVVVRKMEGS